MISDLLSTAFFITGVRDFRAETDQPESRLKITFTKSGKPYKFDMTLREVIACLPNASISNELNTRTGDQTYVDMREVLK